MKLLISASNSGLGASFCLGLLCLLYGCSEPEARREDNADARAEGGPAERLVFVGTYTDGAAEGIYLLRLDSRTGELSPTEHLTPADDPSFLAIHPSGRFIYCVNEMLAVDGEPGVSAYSISPESGELTFLNRLPAGGTYPCHLTVDPTGKNLLVANYGGSSVGLFRLGADGRLTERAVLAEHVGSSVHERQDVPHPHGVTLDPTNRFAFIPDLGLDRIVTYAFDAKRGALTPAAAPFAAVEPGSGPRHFSLGRDGRFGYLINELASTVTVFKLEPKNGALVARQTVSTLPEAFRGQSTTAEIEVHPTGRFLYGSNRGHDSIVVFAIEPRSGQLTYVEHESTLGQTPRNFGIDPGGRFLLAANQKSDSVVVFRIDQETGALNPTGHSAEVPTPVCVTFFPQ